MKIEEIVQEIFDSHIKLNYRCPFGKFVADSFSCGETPEEAKENYQEYKKEKSGAASNVAKPTEASKKSSDTSGSNSYPGIASIREKIKASGGAEKFFADSNPKILTQSSMPEKTAEQMKEYFERHKKYGGVIGEEVLAKRGDVTLHDMPDLPGSLVIKAGDHPIGYVQNNGTLVTAIIANEFRGIGGIGKWALTEFFNRNPDMITKTGGVTPNGLKAYTRMLNDIENGNVQKPLTEEQDMKIKDVIRKLDGK